MKFLHSRWAAAAGIFLIVAGQVAWFALREWPRYGALFVIVGMTILFFNRAFDQQVVQTAAPQRYSRLQGEFGVWRYLLLLPGITLVAYVSRQSSAPTPSSVGEQLLIWCIGLGLIFYSLVSGRVIIHWVRIHWQNLRNAPREWLLVLLLLLLALFVRVVWLETFPLVMVDDEGYTAYPSAQHYFSTSYADYMAHTTYHPDWNWNPFRYDGVYQQPILFDTLRAVFISFFGNTLFAVRLPAALFGAITIPGVYLLARRLFDRRIALLSAIFMVAFPVHIVFSRMAFNMTMDSAAIVWAFAFLVNALDTGDRMEFALAGVVIGFSQYGYLAARLIPILVVAYIGWYYLFRLRELRHSWLLLTIPLVLFTAVILPQVAYLLATPQSFLPRLSEISILPPIDNILSATAIPLNFWWQQLTNSLLGYVQRPDRGGFYGVFDPLLGWIAPIPCLIGIAFVLKKIKNPGYFLLMLVLIAGTFFGSVLLLRPLSYERMIVVMPILAILVGIGIAYLGEVLVWLAQHLAPHITLPYWAFPLVLVVLLSTFNLKRTLDYQAARPYFDPSDGAGDLSDTPAYNLTAIAQTVLPRFKGYQIWYFSSAALNLDNSPVLRYLAPQSIGQEFNPDKIDSLSDMAQTATIKQAFVISIKYPDLQKVVEQLSHVRGLVGWTPLSPYSHGPMVYVFYNP